MGGFHYAVWFGACVRKIAADPAVIKAVAAQKRTMDAIKKLEGEWTAARGVTPS